MAYLLEQKCSPAFFHDVSSSMISILLVMYTFLSYTELNVGHDAYQDQ